MFLKKFHSLWVPIHRPRTRPRKMASWLLCSEFTLFCFFYSYSVSAGE